MQSGSGKKGKVKANRQLNARSGSYIQFTGGARGGHKVSQGEEKESQAGLEMSSWRLGVVDCEEVAEMVRCNTGIGRIELVDRETEFGNCGARNPAGWFKFNPREPVLET